MSEKEVTLQPGDELRVDRRFFYQHHALYLGGGVVQFGGQIKDKQHAAIHYASVAEFAKGAQVKVVEHDQLDRAATVRRALWLLDNPPPTTYNLLGYNCEHVARWCATGKIECSQAKGLFTANSFMGGSLLVFVEHPQGWHFGLFQLIVGLLLAWLSRSSTGKFEQHIRENWAD